MPDVDHTFVLKHLKKLQPDVSTNQEAQQKRNTIYIFNRFASQMLDN
jgi:hypothetical protein